MRFPLSRPIHWLVPFMAIASVQAQELESPSLKEVVITGTRTERDIDEVPVRTEVVTREEIERTHAGTLKQALADDTFAIIDCPVDYAENTTLTARLEAMRSPR